MQALYRFLVLAQRKSLDSQVAVVQISVTHGLQQSNGLGEAERVDVDTMDRQLLHVNIEGRNGDPSMWRSDSKAAEFASALQETDGVLHSWWETTAVDDHVEQILRVGLLVLL